MDRFFHDGGEAFELAGLAEAGQSAIREVPQTRREHKAQEVEQGEDMIRDAAGIDAMHQRIELGGISHEPVQDERRLTCGRAWTLGACEAKGVGWANDFTLGQVRPAYAAIDGHATRPRRLRRWLCRKHRCGRWVRCASRTRDCGRDYGLTRLKLRTAGLPWAKA